MTNLKDFQEQINGDIARFNTEVRFAKGTDEEIANKTVEEFAKLSLNVSMTRGIYEDYRKKQIAQAKETAILASISPDNSDVSQAERTANKFIVELIAATDAQAQNVALNELENTLKYFTAGAKVAFYQHIPMINSLLVDKATSKSALQSVITEMKNYVNPFEVAYEEAKALPTIIGEEYEEIEAQYKVEEK